MFVRYNYQRELQQFPGGLWWRQTGPSPVPNSIQGKNKSDSWSGSITHVFSPTMTNETVIAYTFVGFPNVFEDPAKVLVPMSATAIPVYSTMGSLRFHLSVGCSSEAALVFNPGGFEAGERQRGCTRINTCPASAIRSPS